MSDDKAKGEQFGPHMRGRYWLSGSGPPAWVPLVELDQISDEEWRDRCRRQPWWGRLRLWWHR